MWNFLKYAFVRLLGILGGTQIFSPYNQYVNDFNEALKNSAVLQIFAIVLYIVVVFVVWDNKRCEYKKEFDSIVND